MMIKIIRIIFSILAIVFFTTFFVKVFMLKNGDDFLPIYTLLVCGIMCWSLLAFVRDL